MRTYFYIVSRMDQREGSAGGGIARRGFMVIVAICPLAPTKSLCLLPVSLSFVLYCCLLSFPLRPTLLAYSCRLSCLCSYPEAADAKPSPDGDAERKPQLPVERCPFFLGVLYQYLRIIRTT